MDYKKYFTKRETHINNKVNGLLLYSSAYASIHKALSAIELEKLSIVYSFVSFEILLFSLMETDLQEKYLKQYKHSFTEYPNLEIMYKELISFTASYNDEWQNPEDFCIAALDWAGLSEKVNYEVLAVDSVEYWKMFELKDDGSFWFLINIQ